MKHIMLLVFVCIVAYANAQTEKGNFLLGGSASFTRTTTDNSKNTSFSLSPNVSYFVANRFALGIITPFSTSNGTTTGVNGGTVNSSSYAIGPTLRYYFPISPQWAIFPELDYYYHWSNTRLDVSGLGPAEFKSTASIYRINLGLTYFITRSIGLEGILYYQKGNGDDAITISEEGSTYGVRFGLQIYLLRDNDENK